MFIKQKLTIVFFAITVIPIAFISSLIFLNAKESLRRATFAGLAVIAESKSREVSFQLEKMKARTENFVSDGLIRSSLEEISRQGSGKLSTQDTLNTHLLKNKKILDENIVWIDVLDLRGKVVASSNPKYIGIDKSQERYFIFGLKKIYFSDIYEEGDGFIRIDIAAPLKQQAFPFGVIGVLINHFSADGIGEVLAGRFISDSGVITYTGGIGETGETYLVNEDRMLAVGSISTKNVALKQKVDTYPVKKCFEENANAVGIWPDYQGTFVAGSSVCLDIGDFRWVLISEQNKSEVFASINDLGKLLVMVGGIIFVIVSLFVFSVTKPVLAPLQELTKATETIAKGHFDVKVDETEASSEIGILAGSFNKMIDSLSEARKKIETEVYKRKESERWFRQFVESAPDAAISINRSGRVVLVNARTEKMFGYHRKELYEKTAEVLIPDRFREKYLEYRQQYFQDPRSWLVDRTLDICALHKDGTEIPVNIGISPVTIENELFILCTIRDIRERKQAEEELNEKTERLQRFKDITVAREMKMVELKEEINALLAQSGKPEKFKVSEIIRSKDKKV